MYDYLSMLNGNTTSDSKQPRVLLVRHWNLSRAEGDCQGVYLASGNNIKIKNVYNTELC